LESVCCNGLPRYELTSRLIVAPIPVLELLLGNWKAATLNNEEQALPINSLPILNSRLEAEMPKTKTRQRRLIKQVVAGLIVRKQERVLEILICQRTKHQSMPLKWEFPGGKIESGEQPRDALRRELEEELGIDAEIEHEVARVRHDYNDAVSVELRFFLVPSFQGELENRIFKQVVWTRLEELPRFDFLEADISLVKRLAAGELLLNQG
jgi:8-oxo-dGTP diphosphatase